MTGEPTANAPTPRLVRLMLALVAGSLAALAGTVFYFTAGPGARLDPAELDSSERQRLIEGVLADSPGIHQWAYFEPRIGYTLRPDRPIEAWHDSFRTNEIGYRAPPLAKQPGTFRIVFAGDSWTYGMGVTRSQSFPAVIERLANAAPRNATADNPRRIEAWSMALPGYNLFNSLAALEFFWNQLQPDAIVVVPSDNDHYSSAVVLPNGSLWLGATVTDDFGAPHITHYEPRVGSFEADRRWQASADAVARVAARAAAAGAPVALLFVARWPQAEAHAFMERTGLAVPYGVVEPALTLGEWENPAPDLHGTPAANEMYGALGYELLATLLGWEHQPREQAFVGGAVFATLPPASSWRSDQAEHRRWANAAIGESFDPADEPRAAVAGQIDFPSGAIPRASTLLVRRRAGTTTLIVTVERIAEPSLYPLGLQISLPSRSDGSQVRHVLEADDPENVTLTLPIPTDIPPGDVIDVILEADRAIAPTDGGRLGRSLRVRSITQE